MPLNLDNTSWICEENTTLLCVEWAPWLEHKWAAAEHTCVITTSHKRNQKYVRYFYFILSLFFYIVQFLNVLAFKMPNLPF